VKSLAKLVALATLVTVLLAAPTVRAHDPFQITTDARVHADRIDLKVTMAQRTTARLCLGTAVPASPLPRPELEKLRAELESCGSGLYRLTAGGEPLVPRSTRVVVTEENDVETTLVYPPPGRSPLVFDAVHLARLSNPTFGDELTVTGDGTFLGQKLLRADDSILSVDAAVATRAPEASGPISPAASPFGGYLRVGVERILTGYDGLLFLGALLLACRSFRSVLGVVTCFTLAHSIALTLAALDVVTLPSHLVEPLIAATVVLLGVDNVVRGDEPKGRWALAFACGLIHGLGSAGALRRIGVGVGGAPPLGPLFSFNLGALLGQIAVAAILLPLLFKLRTMPWFARRGTPIISLMVGLAGLYWLLERTLFS
jgi:hypothetical protein